MANLIHSILAEHNRSIVYVHPDVSITQCVDMMVRGNIGALVVMDDDNVLGLLSERDVIRSLVHKGLPPTSTKASDVMCAEFTMLSPNDTVETAMEAITHTRRRHLLIAESGKIIAILSIGDILFTTLDDKNRQIEHLQNYIHS